MDSRKKVCSRRITNNKISALAVVDVDDNHLPVWRATAINRVVILCRSAQVTPSQQQDDYNDAIHSA